LDTTDWTEKKLMIVRTIVALAGQKGFEKVSTSGIASVAGVGEGTIYRHFKSKNELVDVAAVYAAEEITAKILMEYDEEAEVVEQYNSFCLNFIRSGKDHPLEHGYLQHYIGSLRGMKYRQKIHKAIEDDGPENIHPLLYPLNVILARAQKQRIVKDLPLTMLALLTIGTLTTLVRDCNQGVFVITDEMLDTICEACWDAISR